MHAQMKDYIVKFVAVLALCTSLLTVFAATPAASASTLSVGGGRVTITSFSGDIIVGTCQFGTITVQGSGRIVNTPGASIFHVSGSNADGWVLAQSDAYIPNGGVSVGSFDFSNSALGADIRLRFVSTNGVDLSFSEGDC